MASLRQATALLAFLACLSVTMATPVDSGVTCHIGDVTIKPGESHVFEKNCGRHNCTCSGCSSQMIGCLDGAKCYKNGDAATLSRDGRSLQCTCRGSAGMFGFEDCKADTCTDSTTKEEKKSGEQVNYVDESGVEYLCTCSGTSGLTGCRSKTCLDADGSRKKVGEKVHVKRGDAEYICDCAGLDGFKNCMNKADYDNAGKCKDMDGKYAEKGARYRVKNGDMTLECTCAGNNSGTECTLA